MIVDSHGVRGYPGAIGGRTGGASAGDGGKLRQVRVTGRATFRAGRFAPRCPPPRKNSVPNFARVAKELTALNAQTPDRVVLPVLKAGPQPGTVDLSLRVQDHSPFHGSVELNNQYTADTTHLRAL